MPVLPLVKEDSTKCNSSETTNDDFCNDPRVKDKSASDFCKDTEKEGMEMGAQIASSLASMTPWGALSNIFGSKAETEHNSKIKMEIEAKSKTMAEQESMCENTIKQSATNSITVGLSDSCIDRLLRMEISPAEIKEMMKNSKAENITQSNVQTARNECKINLVLDALSKMDVGFDNEVIQKAMTEAKGMGSNSKSTTNSCSEISASMSACKHIKQKQCCAATINQDHTNELNGQCGGSFTNIVQSNVADAVNSCMLSATASISDDITAKIKNKVTQIAETKSEGMTLGGFLIMALLGLAFFASIFILPMIAGKQILDKIFYIAGGVLIIVSIVFMSLYVKSRIPEERKYDQPYISCEGVKSLNGTLARSSYGKVKERVKNSDVKGYDFFADVPSSGLDPRNMKDDQTGSVMYITVRPSNDCKFDPPTDKQISAVVSYMKSESNTKYLVLALFTALLGVASIIVGVIKSNMKDPLAATPDPLATPVASPDSTASP